MGADPESERLPYQAHRIPHYRYAAGSGCAAKRASCFQDRGRVLAMAAESTLDNRSILHGTCFVAASIDVDLTTLARVLRDRGLYLISSETLEPAPESLAQYLRQVIADSVLVVAVLSDKQNANVIFELGLAAGQRIPHLLIVTAEATDVPSDLADLLMVRAALDNYDALALGVDRALADQPTGPSPTSERPDLPVLGQEADLLLAELTSNQIDREFLFEQFVEDIFRRAGLEPRHRAGLEPHHKGPVPYDASPRDFLVRPDFVVWVDELQATFGNPLVVEVLTQLSTSRLRSVQFERILETSGARSLLVIYRHGPSQPTIQQTKPNRQVLCTRVDELIHALRDTNFTHALTSLKRSAVDSALLFNH
jgi:hypothetical protein